MARKYLIYCEDRKNPGKRVAQWVGIPDEWNSDDYGKLQQDFAKQHAASSVDYADMQNFASWELSRNGILFHEELAGPNGMSFTLYPMPNQPHSEVMAAKEQLRHERDVVHISICRIHRLLDPSS